MKVIAMRILVLLFAVLCASCSSTLPSLKPYHLDVQQGNVVTSKMMLQLKPGMSKSTSGWMSSGRGCPACSLK